MKRFLNRAGRALLVLATILYLGILVLLPLAHLLFEAFRPGWAAFRTAATTEYALAALANTALMVGLSLAVTIPMGVLAALVLVRDDLPGRGILDGLVDLPFAAPAAIGAFALLVTYGPRGLLGPLFTAAGFQVVFARPGMLLATVFVTLPFVIRETAAILEEVGTESEEAARTLGASPLQTLFLVTIPGVREGILFGAAQAYARALGEFGAILVLSGNILGATQTTPIYIYDAYIDFEMEAAYAGAAILAALSLGGMAILSIWRRRWHSWRSA